MGVVRANWGKGAVLAVALTGCEGLVQAQAGTEASDGDATDAATGDDGGTPTASMSDGVPTASASAGDGGDAADDGPDDASASASASDTTSAPETGDGGSSSSDADDASDGPPAACGDGQVGGDEDCDDANDSEIDGCTSTCAFGPVGLAFGAVSTTDQDGGNHGQVTPFSDDCPAGQVLTGLSGRLTSQGLGSAVVLGRIQGECSSLSLVDADPTSIDSAAGASLTQHGGYQEIGNWSLACPAGSAITAFEGRAGSIIDSLEVTCTPLAVDGSASNQVLELGPPAQEGPAGGAGGMAFGPVGCPDGAIATGLAGHTNSYVIRLALRCREVSLAYP